MKQVILLLAFACMSTFLCAQNPEEAEKLVTEGVALHDKGEYDAALDKYKEALNKDKYNLDALAEQAYTYLTLNKPDKVIACCKKAISKHPGEDGLKNVYVTYGNALDAKKKTQKALDIYDEGIRSFPNYYQLHYNKGVTLASANNIDDALACFEKAVTINPGHASSHNAIARLQFMKGKKVPALLAFCRFMVIEPESKRAVENLVYIKKIMKGGAKKTGKNSISITLDAGLLGDTTASGKPKENSFSTTELIMTMNSALDFDDKNEQKTEVENFIRKFESVCASLEESKEKNYGFYWSYYVPYFLEIKKQNKMDMLAHLVFATSTDDRSIQKWLYTHKAEVENFVKWSQEFEWKSN